MSLSKRIALAPWAVLIALLAFSGASVAGVYVSGPLPSEFSGGFVSPNPGIFGSATKAHKEGSKLQRSLSKCYSKGATNVSKGRPSGVSECINASKKGALARFTRASDAIQPRAQCITDNLRPNISGPLLNSIVKSFNSAFYCQSPSGAFLDRLTF